MVFCHSIHTSKLGKKFLDKGGEKMQYTDRLGLKKPDQNDIYNVDDFNYNYQKISESFAGVPTPTDYMSIDDFVASEQVQDIKKGDAVIVNGVVYVLIGSDSSNKDNYVPYGADGVVIMHEYVPIEQRTKGSMYLQLGKTRRLIVRVFKKFFNREYTDTDTSDTLTFKQSDTKTENVDDGNKYRFTCKNLSILEDGDTSERLEEKLYFVIK